MLCGGNGQLPGVIFNLSRESLLKMSTSSSNSRWLIKAERYKNTSAPHAQKPNCSQILNIPMMLPDTGLRSEPPARSICVIVPGGGWHQCQAFHAAHRPLWADLARCILPFQRVWRVRGKRQKETLFTTGRGGVTGHRAHRALSSPRPPPED